MNAYVKSNFERNPDDHYPTIDDRCVRALWESWSIPTPIWEPCAPTGSGIADAWPGEVICTGKDADQPDGFRSIVTNPPYDRAIVDGIVESIVERIGYHGAEVAALLMRTAWDHARSRRCLFDHPSYAGQVKMRFRPWWSEDRTKQPIHNYVWHIWDRRHRGEPVVRYWG